MAVFNEIDEGGLNNILTRRLGMPGGSPAPSLAPEIMPQLVLENDRPEWGWPKGEMRCAGYFFGAAVAGSYTFYEWWNPPSSKSLFVIDYFENISASDLVITRAAVSTRVGGTTQYGGVCDLRFAFRTHQAQVTNNTSVAVPSSQGVFAFLNGNFHSFQGNIIMPPNSLVRIYCPTVNTSVEFNLNWYERVAQDGELV